MKVQLLKPVPHLGRASEIVEVTEAYARNYLLPNKLAAIATPQVLAQAASAQARSQAEAERLKKQAQLVAERLQGMTIAVTGQANDQGRLFAAVKSAAVVEAIERQLNVTLHEAKVQPDHFKQLGVQSAKLLIPGTVPIAITVDLRHA
ncbi:MAG: 50S ribosomal protein L9 [Candidatus Kerfeldbacteria bacterium]|nr:50S ribosomal protein L9 [Candidatus Kerfeldbacteria bacterium]